MSTQNVNSMPSVGMIQTQNINVFAEEAMEYRNRPKFQHMKDRFRHCFIPPKPMPDWYIEQCEAWKEKQIKESIITTPMDLDYLTSSSVQPNPTSSISNSREDPDQNDQNVYSLIFIVEGEYIIIHDATDTFGNHEPREYCRRPPFRRGKPYEGFQRTPLMGRNERLLEVQSKAGRLERFLARLRLKIRFP